MSGCCRKCGAVGYRGLCPPCNQDTYAPVRAAMEVAERLERIERHVARIAEKLGAAPSEEDGA